MQTLIFRTMAPLLCAMMILFSIFVCLRGHNEPGGGFIGGLIAACAFSVYIIAFGSAALRKAILVHPMAVAGFGLFFATATGFISVFRDQPFFTGQWVSFTVFGATLELSTPLFFDIGVYFVVAGSITAILLELEMDGN